LGQIINVKVSYRAERSPGGSHIIKMREGTCFTTLVSVGQVPKMFRKHLLRDEFSICCAEFRSAGIAKRVAAAMGKPNGKAK